MAETKFEVVYRREEAFVADVKCPRCGNALEFVNEASNGYLHACRNCQLNATLSQKFPKRAVKGYTAHTVTDQN